MEAPTRDALRVLLAEIPTVALRELSDLMLFELKLRELGGERL